MINTIQIAIAFLIVLIFGYAYYLGWRRMREQKGGGGTVADPTDSPYVMGLHANLLVGLGALLIAGLLGWRTLGDVRAAIDYLDVFLLLAFLLAAAQIYLRGHRRLGGLSLYIGPMIAFVLLLGIGLQLIRPGPFPYYEKAERVWNLVHVGTILIGTLCFALACVGGIVYLSADHRLKNRKMMGPVDASRFPSLATLERFNRWMVYPGFFLLTIGIAAGALAVRYGDHEKPRAKIAIALAAWLIYAVLLPRAPAFRGKRSAWLSIVGFAFILAGYVATSWIQ
ncbi:MAG: cytochrome c biogenesis protein [Phycisphaerales bacterium]|nr:cytochrome c biogenesis protein [Phycisphaerales bacterium]